MALNTLSTARGCLGFTNAADVFITDQQGLDSLHEFHPLTDDEVENLIKVTHHPGGTIPNPAPVGAGVPALLLIPKSWDTSLSTCRKQLAINVLLPLVLKTCNNFLCNW